MPSIARKTERGLPRYVDLADSDVFLLAGAEDLVPVSGLADFDDGNERVRRYHPRTEGLFARIERRTHLVSGDVYFRVVTKDNVTNTYGKSASARIVDPADGRRIFRWLLDETRDDRGNVTVYEYKAENSDGVTASLFEASRQRGAQRYLKRIRYGNRVANPAQPSDWLFEVVFDYGDHAQPWDANETATWPEIGRAHV